jgi:colicin import membrane protein
METALAIAPDTAKTSALTRWDALAADIAIATEQAEGKAFDYRDKWDNRQARSWVAQLRKIKGKIERARKDAKAVHLDRGKAVDEAAKLLEASVQGLIEPHERKLKVLEAEEQARIDGHKAVLELIAELAEGAATSAESRAMLAELTAIDTTTLEEFSAAGANRQLEGTEKLQTLIDALQIQESERAELERLRAEQAQRQEAERQESIRQQAIAAERQSAAEAAAAREAQAQANVAAAQQAQQIAERRAADAERQAEASRQAEAARQADAAAAAQRAQEAREKRAADLELSILAALQGLTREQVAAAIVAGTLHQAVSVDWTYA